MKSDSCSDTSLKITNVALLFAGLACLVKGVHVLWTANEGSSAATALTAGLFLLLASTIDRFEVLKGWGLEARTKQLDKTLSEAVATLNQLREIAELSSESIVSLNSKAGRWDSAPSAQVAYEVVKRVRANLMELGSAEQRVKQIMEPWVKVTTNDLVRVMLTELRKSLQLGSEHYRIQLQSYPLPIQAGDSNHQLLLDSLNKFGSFEGDYFGSGNDWPIGSHASKLVEFVEKMPLLDESDRLKLRHFISPWLSRLERLASDYELLDEDEWFKSLDEEKPSSNGSNQSSAEI
ncbi:hypothetical protein [Limnohabitans sp.]|uniref:hypothetical protein n=1 Tax=Limnohabitans sp. TaxID=1907725 RepID=UPI00286F435E|nr:hypothetical protein [Limnohabitans sp.]